MTVLDITTLTGIPNRDVRFLHSKLAAELIPLLQDLELAYKTRLTQSHFKLYEGWRSPLRQDALFKKGTTKARRWQSAHQYGLAVDLVPVTGVSGWTWNSDDWEWLRDFVERRTSLRRTIGWDKPHFEHPLWWQLKDQLIP